MTATENARDVSSATTLVEELLRCGGGDERFILSVLDRWGVDRVAAMLIDEVVFRADVPTDCGEVFVAFDIVHNTERIGHLLRVVEGAQVRLVGDSSEPVGMRIEYRAVDLVRELFGPSSERTAGANATELMPGGTRRPNRDDVRRIGRATYAVLAGCTSTPPDLGGLALRYASDKWGGIHRFTPHYERHLGPLRDHVIRVLEIGIGGYDNMTPGGGSLKMWKRYFTRGQVYGIDIFDKPHVNETRVRALRGRQDDPAFMREVGETYGPFDVVIDDGSHVNEHVRTSLELMFPYVRGGGCYVIEDLWTSYLPGWGGHSTPGADPTTSMELIKGLVDAVHHEEHEHADCGVRGDELPGLHIYHNIAFIEKGTNREGGVPQWIPREPFWNDTSDRRT